MEVFNLPNTLTIFRIISIPFFVIAIIYNKNDYALYLFIAASITDALDGLIARKTNQRTPLGTFLDPLADKFLIVTAFVLFAYYGWIPLWLTIAVLSRDIIVVTGWFLLFLTTNKMNVKPTVTGKLAIALQLVLMCYVLIGLNYEISDGLMDFLIWATAILTATSGLHYIYRGFKETNEKVK